MHKESMIDRRRFLSNVSAMGLFTLFPFFEENSVVHKDPYEEKALRSLYKNALISVMEKQASHNDETLSPMQIRNLDYAYDQINPTNHQEMAFVVACSMSEEPRNDVVDEYVRRREGKESLLPDHPLMALEEWAMPDTQRILIFKEQLQLLLKVLTGSENCVSLKYLYRLTFQKDDMQDKFVGLLLEEWRKLLTSEEITTIYKAFEYYFPKIRPYHWCSTMVTRATALVSKSGGSIYG
jgi:hypothetical protein